MKSKKDYLSLWLYCQVQFKAAEHPANLLHQKLVHQSQQDESLDSKSVMWKHSGAGWFSSVLDFTVNNKTSLLFN